MEAFKLAVHSVNTDSSLVRGAKLNGLVETAESDDDFTNMEKGIMRGKTFQFLQNLCICTQS